MYVCKLFIVQKKRHKTQLTNCTGTDYVFVWKMLKEDGQHPSHCRRMQCLQPNDYATRVAFSQWIVDRVCEEPDFLKVLFTDECSFHRTGVLNAHYEHVKPSHFQHRWRINWRES